VGKGRLEAFSDGVIAIIITIMVLEMEAPHSADWTALRPILPVLGSYVLSFIYVGIYWNNHHHLLHTVKHVRGGMLWANTHLLFWLSLVPFTTRWMGETHFAPLPVALYGVVLLFAAVAFTILVRVIIAHHGKHSDLALAVGDDRKGKISLTLYALAVVLAFFQPLAACLLYVVVAVIWLVPDRRIERQLNAAHS
jgi:uncharacterized membrane protein